MQKLLWPICSRQELWRQLRILWTSRDKSPAGFSAYKSTTSLPSTVNVENTTMPMPFPDYQSKPRLQSLYHVIIWGMFSNTSVVSSCIYIRSNHAREYSTDKVYNFQLKIVIILHFLTPAKLRYINWNVSTEQYKLISTRIYSLLNERAGTDALVRQCFLVEPRALAGK
jgi:hypothetical protein